MNNNENNVNINNNQELAVTQQATSVTANEQVPKKSKLGFILLILGVILIVAGIASSFILPKEESMKEDNTQNETTNNDNSSNEITDNSGFKTDILTEYNGILQYDMNELITDKFNITIPTEFVNSDTDSNYIEKELETDGQGIFNSCTIKLSQIINFNDANLLATSMAKHHSADATLTTKEINGITWYNFQYEHLGMSDTYITEKDGKIYLAEYVIEKDANKDVCTQYKDSIINSISYK